MARTISLIGKTLVATSLAFFAGSALSQAYRDFSDAAAQAADSNNAGALASAKTALSDALRTFDEAAGTGN